MVPKLFRAKRGVRCAAVLLIVSALAEGCANPRLDAPEAVVKPTVIQTEQRYRKEYVLVPGDEIEVAVWRVPEVSRIVKLRPDGYISLPLIDDVLAAGRTPSELDHDLTERFSARLTHPEVTIIASQVREPMVYVVGDVRNPSAVSLHDAATAMQAIAQAGGLNRNAASRDVALIRLNEEGYLQAVYVNAELGGQPGPYLSLAAVPLQPDDVLFVPESGRSQVARFLDDFVTRPLLGVSALTSIIVNFRLVKVL